LLHTAVSLSFKMKRKTHEVQRAYFKIYMAVYIVTHFYNSFKSNYQHCSLISYFRIRQALTSGKLVPWVKYAPREFVFFNEDN